MSGRSASRRPQRAARADRQVGAERGAAPSSEGWLAAYRPGVDGPWERAEAAHLLRRAGFCPCEPEIRRALRDGLDATVERLVGGAPEPAGFVDLDGAGEAIAARGSIEQLAAWWLMRAVRTARPLHARMCLLWHNHFATSNRKVGSPALMLQQFRTFERLGLGGFEGLLHAAARDPAMIVWLDGDSNRKGKPNENFARELFELFALGPGNYTERDIREAARAFSGWHTRGGAFHFNARLHDDGEKTVFGRRGALGGDEVVSLCVEHPACAAFVAQKLLREFVTDRPDAELTAQFAEVLRGSGLDLSAALRRLLRSRAFFEASHRRARVKSPIEFCVGLVRSFEMRTAGRALHEAASQMGQRLFEPPSVKGWEGGRRWINSSTMLVRMNAATAAAAGRGELGLDAPRWVAELGLADARAAVDFACDLMLDDQADAELRGELYASCGGTAGDALRSAVAAIGSSPEYQLA